MSSVLLSDALPTEPQSSDVSNWSNVRAHLHSCASSRDHNSPIMIFYSFRVILLCFLLANHSHSFVYVSHAFTILKKFVVMFCRHGPPHTVSRKIYYEISRI